MNNPIRLKMKILVTGLCLSRNLGGAAMALTLVKELNKRFNDVHFTFAVTPNAMDEELYWARKYGLDVVARDNPVTWWLYGTSIGGFARLVLSIFRKLKHSKNLVMTNAQKNAVSIHSDYMDAFEQTDCVIDMSGITYVGDGVHGSLHGLKSYGNFYYAKLNEKPFVRFIQSFGPFDDWKVRYFAKKEFKSLAFIPARGKQSAEFCRALVRDKSKVHSFPDVAILLPPDYSWANSFIHENHLTSKGYAVVSPSSVIYRSVSKSVGGSVGEKHVESMVKVCEGLIQMGEKIVFLPHMYSKNSAECDRQVARLIANRLPEESYLIVEEQLDPMMAKGLIALSKFAIVSRYHALVAALSTNVDVITIGWNIKYQDMMEYYDKDKYAVDMRQHEPKKLAQKVLDLVNEFDTKTEHIVGSDSYSAQENAKQRVDESFDLLASWINSVVSTAKA
jgi:polysaccharide pyruvyl transferase WcaK-like protein